MLSCWLFSLPSGLFPLIVLHCGPRQKVGLRFEPSSPVWSWFEEPRAEKYGIDVVKVWFKIHLYDQAAEHACAIGRIFSACTLGLC